MNPAEQGHWSERGRATSVAYADAQSRPRRSVPTFDPQEYWAWTPALKWVSYRRMKDWSECLEVERNPGRVSGAWLFRGTRVPVGALFENLEDGATVDEFLEWFPGMTRRQVEAVLDFATSSLEPLRVA